MLGDQGPRRVLQRRVAELDATDRPWATSPGPAGLIEHVVSVLSARTGDPVEAGTGPAAALDPATADEIVAGCRVLADLGRDRPDLVAGPLPDRQQWIGTARHRRPEQAAFLPPGTAPSREDGLWTSTAGPDGRSSWRAYGRAGGAGLPGRGEHLLVSLML